MNGNGLLRCRRGVRTLVAAALACFGAGAQEDRAAEALRALKGDQRPSGAEFEASRAKWPLFDHEIEAGTAKQDEALRRGGTEADDVLKHFQNRADVRNGPEDLYLAGRMLGSLGRIEEAKTRFEASIRVDPYFPWGYHGLGTCHAKRDRFEEAIKAFKKGLELNPDFLRSKEPLAGCLIQLGRVDEAEEILRGVVARNPDQSAAILTLAKLQATRLRYGDAIANLKTLLAKAPNDEEALRILGYCYRKSDQIDEAVRLYQGVLAKSPDDYGANRALGDIKLRQGENHAAADYFEKALKVRRDLSSPETEELRKLIDELRKRPAVEKRDPKQKTPEEWIDILLHSTEPERCEEAVRVLRSFPPEVRDVELYGEVQKSLVRALRLKHAPGARTLVLRQLIASPVFDPAELVGLVSLFADDPDRRVRGMAFHFLGESESPAAVPAALKGLDDSDPYVFEQAYDALFKLTPAYLPPRLPETLDKEAMATAATAWKRWYADHRDRYRRYEAKKEE